MIVIPFGSQAERVAPALWARRDKSRHEQSDMNFRISFELSLLPMVFTFFFFLTFAVDSQLTKFTVLKVPKTAKYSELHHQREILYIIAFFGNEKVNILSGLTRLDL